MIITSRFLDGECLDGFGKNELAVYTLGGQETDLSVHGKEFIQTLQASALTVGDPIIGEVTKCDRLCTCRRNRSIYRSHIWTIENGIRKSAADGGLPDIVLFLSIILDTFYSRRM